MKTGLNDTPKNQQRIVIISRRKNQVKKLINKIKNIMKKITSILTIIAALAVFISCKKPCSTVCENGGIVTENCGCDCPSDYTGPQCEIKIAPPSPPTPPCQLNHWSYVYFENKTKTKSSYDVYWDGAKVATLAPGKKSITITASVGSHTLEFKKKNSATVACNKVTVKLAQCTTNSWYCTF